MSKSRTTDSSSSGQGDGAAEDVENVQEEEEIVLKSCSVALRDVRKRKFGDEIKIDWQQPSKIQVA